MRRLYHIAGGAWSYITNNMESNNFVIAHSGMVPQFLDEAEQKLQHRGRMRAVIKDIEGCFPNMDKRAIRQGLREEMDRITQVTGHEAVYVPRKKTAVCTFSKPTKGMIQIPFDDLLDIMNFALENTIMIDFNGQLWRQTKGIPMGDPHSPGCRNGNWYVRVDGA